MWSSCWSTDKQCADTGPSCSLCIFVRRLPRPQMHKHVHLELTSNKRKKRTILCVKKDRHCILKSHLIPFIFPGNIALLGIVSKRGCQDKTNRWSPPGSGLRRGSDRQICTSHSAHTQPYAVQTHRTHALI